MSLYCCFTSCESSPLTQSSARVEIKSAIPKSGLGKHNGSLLVSWKKNGEAVFHPECWSSLLTLARKRTSTSSSRKRKLSSFSPNNIQGLVMAQNEKVMVKQASKTVEKFDSTDEVERWAKKVAKMIRESKHCVFFTGAGISTSAGLGDFRGKSGKWTEQDREALDVDRLFENSEATGCDPSPNKISSAACGSRSATEKKEPEITRSISESSEEEDNVAYEDLRPTFTHEVISRLIQLGHVKYLISQNCDGLHLLSGVPSEKISELHGNVFVEKCEKCDKRYERCYYVCDDVSDMYLEELSDQGETDIIAPKFMKKCQRCGLCHRTGRRCDVKGCKGQLIDTIINFGDGLEESILDRAYEAAGACDLMLCLGTTLMVTPANELVDYVQSPRRIVICNRQPTDKDDTCQEKDAQGKTLGVRVYGDCDTFMKYMMLQMLGEKDFDKFENDLKIKLKTYDEKRKAQSSQ